MTDPILMTVILGLFVGVVLGITGAGGAILSLPLLVFFLDIKMVDAAPISLMAITLSASISALLGLKNGIVRYKAATLLAFFGILCAPLGVYFAHQLPEKVLAILFAIVLIVVSVRSFQKFKTPSLLIGDDCDDPNGCPDQDSKKIEPACSVNPATSKLFWTAPCTKRLILTGGFSGFISGLLGVGGGFIIVPTLHSISNLENRMIVATSLAVIALVSMASALSYVGSGMILWNIAFPFVIATVFGMLFGRLVNHIIPDHINVLFFAILSLIIAIVMMIKFFINF